MTFPLTSAWNPFFPVVHRQCPQTVLLRQLLLRPSVNRCVCTADKSLLAAPMFTRAPIFLFLPAQEIYRGVSKQRLSMHGGRGSAGRRRPAAAESPSAAESPMAAEVSPPAASSPPPAKQQGAAETFETAPIHRAKEGEMIEVGPVCNFRVCAERCCFECAQHRETSEGRQPSAGHIFHQSLTASSLHRPGNNNNNNYNYTESNRCI